MIYWRVDNYPVNIKRLSNSHLKSCREFLKRNSFKVFGDYTVPFWILMIERELNYRRVLKETILDELPFLKDLSDYERN